MISFINLFHATGFFLCPIFQELKKETNCMKWVNLSPADLVKEQVATSYFQHSITCEVEKLKLKPKKL